MHQHKSRVHQDVPLLLPTHHCRIMDSRLMDLNSHLSPSANAPGLAQKHANRCFAAFYRALLSHSLSPPPSLSRSLPPDLHSQPISQSISTICTRSTPPPWSGRSSHPPWAATLLHLPDISMASRRRGACSTCMGAGTATVMRLYPMHAQKWLYIQSFKITLYIYII